MDELIRTILSCTSVPMGPDDVFSAKCLLNKNILAASSKEGVGCYAKLIDLDIENKRYIVKLDNNQTVKMSWIVKF